MSKRPRDRIFETRLCKRLRESVICGPTRKRKMDTSNESTGSTKRSHVDYRMVSAEACAEACATRGERFELAASVLDHTAKRDNHHSRIDALYRARQSARHVRLLTQQDKRIRDLNGELLETRAELNRLKSALLCIISISNNNTPHSDDSGPVLETPTPLCLPCP